MSKVRNQKEVYLVALNAALGSFLFGFQMVNISPLEKLFANVNSLTPQKTQIYTSILTSAFPFGAILGSLMLKTLMANVRARMLMIFLDLAAILSMFIQDYHLSFVPLFTGRFILGIIIGINSGLIPQYIFAITPKTLIGSVGCLHQAMLTVGITFGYGLGFTVDSQQVFNNFDWRFYISFPMITCFFRSLVLLFFLPYELPSQNLRKKDIQRLQIYYSKINESENIKNKNQLENIQDKILNSKNSILSKESKDSTEIKKIKGYDSKLNIILCVILAFSNQLCGINAILFYAWQLFMKITKDDTNLCQMLVLVLGIVQFVSSFIGGMMIDQTNKKYFLISGQFLMICCLYSIYRLQQYQVMVILLIFCHTVVFSFGVGQLLVYYGGILIKQTSIIVITNWIATFLIALSGQFMIKNLGIGKMCLSFSFLLVVCLIIIIKGIPSEKQYQFFENEQSQKEQIIQLRKQIQMSTNQDNSIKNQLIL